MPACVPVQFLEYLCPCLCVCGRVGVHVHAFMCVCECAYIRMCVWWHAFSLSTFAVKTFYSGLGKSITASCPASSRFISLSGGNLVPVSGTFMSLPYTVSSQASTTDITFHTFNAVLLGIFFQCVHSATNAVLIDFQFNIGKSPT